MSATKDFLETIEMSQYAELFSQNDITADLLSTLSDDDLKQIGVASLGHRKKILEAIGQLQDQSSESISTPQKEDQSSRNPISMSPSIALLQSFVELEHEREIGTTGAHTVTNYRLIMTIDGTLWNIPLSELSTYDSSDGPLVLEWQDDEQHRLEITGTILKDSIVKNAMHQREWETLTEEASKILKMSRPMFKQQYPNIELPKLKTQAPLASNMPAQAPSADNLPVAEPNSSDGFRPELEALSLFQRSPWAALWISGAGVAGGGFIGICFLAGAATGDVMSLVFVTLVYMLPMLFGAYFVPTVIRHTLSGDSYPDGISGRSLIPVGTLILWLMIFPNLIWNMMIKGVYMEAMGL